MKQTFKIPDECKEISIEQVDNTIVTTFEPEFKKGDILVSDMGTICIFNSQVLTPDQFKSEVKALGFEYDFESDTFKVMKWVPKEGDRCFELSISLNKLCVVEILYASRYHKKSYDEGRTFKTKSECEEAIVKIKSVLNETN